MKKLLKKLLLKLNIFLLKIASLNGILSVLYYLFFSRSFWREQRAVATGRLEYFRKNVVIKESNYLLRRNIHRIEKGLIMNPRRKVFALEYIEETVDAYVKTSSQMDEREFFEDKNLKWFRDVLTNYFEVVDLSNSTLKKQHETFKSGGVYTNKEADKNFSVPYQRDFSKLKVSYEDFYELCQLRRSVRWYQSKKVPRDLIDKAISAATLSPSACNRQPFEFRVFDDYEKVQRISGITWGTRGFNHNFNALAVIVGKLDAYFDERDRHVIYIDSALAAMSFMFALETLGLSSCPINWPDVDSFEKQMKKELGLNNFERPIMLISIGYPDKEALVPFSEKKELKQLRNYNKTNKTQ